MADNAGNFHFVSVGSAGQPKNANDRKTIRKAAMRSFRRRERIERVKTFAAECAVEAETKAAASPVTPPGNPSTAPTKGGEFGQSGPMVLLTKPRLHTKYGTRPEENPLSGGEVLPPSTDLYQLINTPSSPKIPIDLGYLNDFSCGDTPDAGYLFDYFLSEIIPIMMPFEGHNQRLLRMYWSRSLMKDPVVLQAALSHAAVHMDVVNQREPSKLAILHTKLAIRLINQRLESKPFVVDNEFIEAVAMIASNSNLTGDLTESQIHMDALQELVRLKGGKDNLGPDMSINAFLSWSDATSARIARSRPRFAPTICTSADLSCTFAAFLPPILHIEEIFGLIGELRKLTNLKKELDNNNTSTIDNVMAFDAQRNALEGRILSLQYTFSTTRGLGFGDIFLDACCIAAAIYISLAFRKFQPSLLNLRASKHDLIGTILKAETLFASLVDLPPSDFPYADILLWVLVVGGSLALDSSETTWFANRLALVVPWTQVRSWKEAEACLNGVLWDDKLRNEACVSLWNEMEDILGFKDATKVRNMEDDFDPQTVGLPVFGLD